MKIWRRFSRAFLKLKLPKKRDEAGPFLSKYRSFQELLSHNDDALELMANLEEKSSAIGAVDFKKSVRAISERVRRIVEILNLISQSGYPELGKRYNDLNSDIEMILSEVGSAGGFPVSQGEQVSARRIAEGHSVLIDRGKIASRGIGFGKAHVAKGGRGVKDFPEGGVLVIGHASVRYAAVLPKAAAIVTDVGGVTVHLATLARELRIPMIVGTETATTVLRNGQEVTVDAINRIVYEGIVEEVVKFSQKGAGAVSPSFKLFEGVLRKVIPLNLIDPDAAGFKPGACKTLHDIIRFAHQKAMQQMFRMSREMPEEADTGRLTGVPLAVRVLDLGGGTKPGQKKMGPDAVLSIPFSAFLSGMRSVEWPGPRHVDMKGFMGMMAHTAFIPEEELTGMGEPSFAFVSAEYMNFSIRLGYHLSVVESYCGENVNGNYIRFFFKGGGADLDRRLRRVRLISGILNRLDFGVKLVEDVIDAVVTKLNRNRIEKKLEVLGRMTAYTKQMDAILIDDASAEDYLNAFIREHLEAGTEK